MTTQELHIAIDILLQKVNSNWNKNLLPQEKDFFINREISKFIKQRINPLSNNRKLSVFDVLKRTHDLNKLIKHSKPIDIIQDGEESYINLPFDYLYHINAEINIKNSCNSSIENTDKNIYTYINTLDSVKIFNELQILSISLVKNNETIELFNLTMLPSDYLPQDNISNYKKIFIINNAIYNILLDKVKNYNIELYYDNSNQQFILKSIEDFTIIYNINNIQQIINKSSIINKGKQLLKYFSSPIRIVDEEYKTEINNSNLSSSKDQSVIGYLRNDKIIIVKPINTIITTVILTYFCKPKKVDLLLNTHSELSNEVLDEIIDNTVKTIKGVISSDTYEKFSNENILIE